MVGSRCHLEIARRGGQVNLCAVNLFIAAILKGAHLQRGCKGGQVYFYTVSRFYTFLGAICKKPARWASTFLYCELVSARRLRRGSSSKRLQRWVSRFLYSMTFLLGSRCHLQRACKGGQVDFYAAKQSTEYRIQRTEYGAQGTEYRVQIAEYRAQRT